MIDILLQNCLFKICLQSCESI